MTLPSSLVNEHHSNMRQQVIQQTILPCTTSDARHIEFYVLRSESVALSTLLATASRNEIFSAAESSSKDSLDVRRFVSRDCVYDFQSLLRSLVEVSSSPRPAQRTMTTLLRHHHLEDADDAVELRFQIEAIKEHITKWMKTEDRENN